MKSARYKSLSADELLGKDRPPSGMSNKTIDECLAEMHEGGWELVSSHVKPVVIGSHVYAGVQTVTVYIFRNMN